MQLGESESTIWISGAPSLGELRTFIPRTLVDFVKDVGLPFTEPFILATLHSETTKSLEYNSRMASNFFSGLAKSNYNLLITAPNPDPSSSPILEEIQSLKTQYPERVAYIPHLGHENYFNAMHHCLFVAGNSSSGIIEAASFKKFTLNVGERQKHRACDENVFHCEPLTTEILATIAKICSINPLDFFKGWVSQYFIEDPSKVVLDFLDSSQHTYYQKSFVDRHF